MHFPIYIRKNILKMTKYRPKQHSIYNNSKTGNWTLLYLKIPVLLLYAILIAQDRDHTFL